MTYFLLITLDTGPRRPLSLVDQYNFVCNARHGLHAHDSNNNLKTAAISERSGTHLHGVEDFYPTAKARIWP